MKGTGMKRVYITTFLTCAAVLAAFYFYYSTKHKAVKAGIMKVGFLYEDDESTPYTWNFALAESELKETWGDNIEIWSKSNVPVTETEEPVRELVKKGCQIIFSNSHSPQFIDIAPEFPQVQFCQVSYLDSPSQDPPENYHTFKGEIYQGRYVSGIAAGMKLRQLINDGKISAQEALIGYVGSFPSASVISGFTAFLLGVRSVVPEAVMRVRYTNTWANYMKEKACAQQLIDEGCVILSHHSDTSGPAVACEEAAAQKNVYFVGFNKGMMDLAPTSALVSTRINWVPYVLETVSVVQKGGEIEHYVSGHSHGNDISAGFDLGWVEVMELNPHIAVKGTQEAMTAAIEALKKGKLEVFQGDYFGVNPADPTDCIDLSKGFKENVNSSSPSFHYILQGLVTEER